MPSGWLGTVGSTGYAAPARSGRSSGARHAQKRAGPGDEVGPGPASSDQWTRKVTAWLHAPGAIRVRPGTPRARLAGAEGAPSRRAAL
jgi:hypothetical protein